jgi:hypothetical protein
MGIGQAALGGPYRSSTSTCCSKGAAPLSNNVELRKRGRWRSNVWTYPGASGR